MRLLSFTVAHGRLLAAALIVSAAAVFVVGVAVEHATSNSHWSTSAAPAATASTPVPESGTSEGGGGDADHGAPVQPANWSPQSQLVDTEQEKITLLGLSIPAESPFTVAAAIVVSLVVAAAVAFRRARFLIVMAAIVASAFAVFDCAELAHQVIESRPGVAVLAGTTKALHIGAVLTACAVILRALRHRRSAPGTGGVIERGP